ncbi:hypothetical protein VC35_20775 [Pseudomonas fluorescens]|uniref:ATP-binding protein n=1 Tax=Pseudomonas fluorescens TaxID=294 RepID=A0A0F4TGB9_PSEFL|nr:hypothetical protein VC35_20775 [Pseudomonas fluorescens]
MSNYRCFHELKLDLSSQLTVLVAENGQGKSTLLDAIRIALWPFINSFDLAKSSTFNDPLNSISIEDIRLIKMTGRDMARQLPSCVSAKGDWGLGEKNWTRIRESEARKTKTKDGYGTNILRGWARDVQAQIRDPDLPPIDLPVFGYYGTGRLWAQKKLTEAKTSEKDDTTGSDFYIRTFAYRNCMDPASSYKHFREWFIWAWESYTNMSAQQHVTDQEKSDAWNRIKVVQDVVDIFLKETTGWHTLEYSVDNERSLILNHEEQGILKVDQLSDGIRSVLAMVGDITYRCIKLNPHLKELAAVKTTGVVLIDEVDMHLHPSWQQLILSQLQKAFKNIQFIVTSHSPQVLTTVPSDCIKIIKRNKIFAAPPGTEGAEPERLLKQVLGLQEVRPPHNRATQELNEYLTLVYNDQWSSERALELRQILDQRYQGNEPELMNADLRIDNRKWELGE